MKTFFRRYLPPFKPRLMIAISLATTATVLVAPAERLLLVSLGGLSVLGVLFVWVVLDEWVRP